MVIANILWNSTFKAAGLKSFLVAVPLHIRLSAPASGRRRRTGDATAGFPNRNKEWWTERIALDCEDEGQPNGEFLSDSVTEHVEVSKACTDGPALKAKLETPPDKLSSLFGVCGCKSMDEGCFYDGNLGLNPVVTLKNATVIGDSGCPPGHGRVGPVIIPYYPVSSCWDGWLKFPAGVFMILPALVQLLLRRGYRHGAIRGDAISARPTSVSRPRWTRRPKRWE